MITIRFYCYLVNWQNLIRSTYAFLLMEDLSIDWEMNLLLVKKLQFLS